MKKIALLLPFFFFALSCEKDDPQLTNDEELITTVRLEFTNGADIKVMQFQDLDGDGGNAPIITADTLDANLTYNVNVFVLNESETPAESINAEIIEEGDEHQFFFIADNNLDLTASYNDMDVNNKPIGLENVFLTGSASEGNLTVILRHQPDKSATNVNAGDITNAGGETDVEVSFSVVVE